MKNLIFILIIFLIECTIGCKQEHRLTPEEVSKLALENLDAYQIKQVLRDKLEETKNLINPDTFLKANLILKPIAMKMVEYWVKNEDRRRNPGNSNEGPIERSVLFNVDEIHLNSPANTQFIRVYFGNYKADDEEIKNYVISKLSSEFWDNYKNRNTVIFAFYDQNLDFITDSKLLNLGGLCPPKCPKCTTNNEIDAEDPLWPQGKCK